MRRRGTGTGFACAKLSEVVARSERSLATVRMTDFLDAETRNRYRLRCAKLSGRGDPCTQWPDFASVVGEERTRMDAEISNRYRLRLREAVRGPSA